MHRLLFWTRTKRNVCQSLLKCLVKRLRYLTRWWKIRAIWVWSRAILHRPSWDSAIAEAPSSARTIYLTQPSKSLNKTKTAQLPHVSVTELLRFRHWFTRPASINAKHSSTSTHHVNTPFLFSARNTRNPSHWCCQMLWTDCLLGILFAVFLSFHLSRT